MMRRHPLDLLSLLAGLTVVVVTVVGLTDAWSLPLAQWTVPAVLVAAGVVVLTAVAVAGRTERPDEVDTATPAAAPTTHEPDGSVAVPDGSARQTVREVTRPLDADALREELLADRDPAAPWASDTVELRHDDEP